MGSGDKDVALRKRQQIDSSKRTMFIFVAVAAFVSGMALVVSFFLVQQIWFQGRVISQKQATVNTINANLKAVDGLKDNIRLLDTNEALSSVKSSDDSSAVQAVLDALPTEPNADALGASLQVMFVGVLLNALCVAIALSGQTVMHFTLALALLGVGWNFLFTGSTSLAVQNYRPEEKDRAQACINFCVFATMAVTSFASGALVTSKGWFMLNMGSIVPLVLTAAALVWLGLRRPVAR